MSQHGQLQGGQAGRRQQSRGAIVRSLFGCSVGLLLAASAWADDSVARCAVTLSDQPQLFLDDYVVAKITNLKREITPPTKHPANPLRGLTSIVFVCMPPTASEGHRTTRKTDSRDKA